MTLDFQLRAMRGSAMPLPVHRFLDQLIRRFGQQRIGRLAVNRLAPDLEHHRYGERRDVVELPMNDVAADARQHLAEAAHVE